MAFVYPGQNNTTVPAAQASLQSNFSRNPSRFKLLNYCTVAEVDKRDFYATQHNPQDEARLISSTGADMVWEDGAYPNNNFQKGHQFVRFHTIRYHRMATLGHLGMQQANWDLVADASTSAASNLMLNRTQIVMNTALTSGNWGSNTNAASGTWTTSSATNHYIQTDIQSAIEGIEKATNSTVDAESLCLVVGPTLAHGISQSPEWRSYLSGSPFSLPNLEGRNFAYGLPDSVYGVKLFVEQSSTVTANPNATATAGYIMTNQALIVQRPGAVVGPLNNTSTLTVATYSDLEVTVNDLPFYKLSEIIVSDDWALVPRYVSGWLITSTY